MKRLIFVDLAGGIGNQIFLFQAANYISSIKKSIILLNKSNIDKSHSGGKSTIDSFVFPNTVKFFKLTFILNKVYMLFRNHLKKYNEFNQSIFLILDESYEKLTQDQLYRLIVTKNPLILIVCGFWQNFEYWDKEFKFSLKIKGTKFNELAKDIETKNPIIFHYRLGKINNRWEHGWGALNPIYLSKALSLLSKKNVESNCIWIFSNDLENAKELIASVDCYSYKLVFIDDCELSPAELLISISKSKVLICSNSTFSLLAARIGQIPLVIVPSELSKNGHRTLAMPNEWEKIDPVWLD